MTKLFSAVFIILIFATSCNNDSPAPAPASTYFVSATPLSETSLLYLQTVAVGLGQSDLIPKLKYAVKTHKLVYKTTYNGKPINASGLIFLPKGITVGAPIISVQHGTTFIKDDAPSVKQEFTGTEFFAALGYITLMPDFIGYGESADAFHPYYDKEHSARAVVDMIKAAKEYLQQEKIAFNAKLFLAGYSEGGYVTLAAANRVETNADDAMAVTAVAAGAGGYDLVELLQHVSTDNYYAYPSYLAFIIMSYNTTNEWNKPLSYFFTQQYADTLTKYMDGKHDGGFINTKLTTSMDKFLNAEFYASLNAGTEKLFTQAVANNTMGGWKTQLQLRLYHGTNDEVVPYHNSEVTLQNFISLESPNVTLTPIAGGTHGSSFIPMLKDVIPWLETMQ